MKAYSLDLRERIVAAIKSGLDQAEVAELFRVSPSTIRLYLRRAAADDLAPRTSPGRPRLIAPADEPALLEQLTTAPDATLEMHRQGWLERSGREVSRSSLDRAITRLGWSRKKSR